VFNGNYPNNVAEQIGPFMNQGNTVANVIWDPNAQNYAWLVLGSDNKWITNSNLDPQLLSGLTNLVGSNNTIKDIIIGPNSSDTWVVICTDNIWLARNIPQYLFNELGNLVNAGFQLKTVVFNPSNSNGWLIICENNGHVVNGLFPSAVNNEISQLIAAKFVLKNVAFMPGNSNGWMIICENNGWVFSNFGSDITTQIGSLMKDGLVLRTVTFGPYPVS
jgi:hypothetical protein